MKKVISLIGILSLISIIGCNKTTTWAESFDKDETIQPISIEQDEKYPEIHYINYKNGIQVQVDTEFGSRNIIVNNEMLYGIDENNKESNESLFKKYNLIGE